MNKILGILAVAFVVLLIVLAAGDLQGCNKPTLDDPHARFHIVDSQTAYNDGDFYDIVDRETGVHYLYVNNGFGAGLSPMYGHDGRVLIEEVE